MDHSNWKYRPIFILQITLFKQQLDVLNSHFRETFEQLIGTRKRTETPDQFRSGRNYD